MIKNLIWQIKNNDKWHFCILWDVVLKILKLVYDFIYYDFDWLLACLNRFFIYKSIHLFKQYINHCSECNINHSKKYCLYDFLQLIFTSAISFHTLILNFILALSDSEFNVILTVVDKFIKKIILIPEKITWTAEQWAEKLFECLVIADWKSFKILISNQNKKFMSAFWKALFKKLKT